MDIDVDPADLERGADRLAGLAVELETAAHRLTWVTGAGRGRGAGALPDRAAALAAGLRADAAELAGCAERLRAQRAGLLAAEAAALAAVGRAACALEHAERDRAGHDLVSGPRPWWAA